MYVKTTLVLGPHAHGKPWVPQVSILRPGSQKHRGRDQRSRPRFSFQILYFTVSANDVVCVVAVTPLLDCAVICRVYEPAGVGRLKGGPWL